MPSISARMTATALIICSLAVGCGDPTGPAKIFDSETGKHAASWPTSHGSSYVPNQETCHDCHGADLGGGISDIGCFTNAACHAAVTSCGSCHGNPPTGTMYPNTAGAHAVHRALNVGFSCPDCHTGAGSGTALHMNYVADVSLSNTLLTNFKAKSGNAAYNPATATCSKISCHGGITTPNWISGSIDVNGQCTSCHSFGTSAQSPEYNSYYSGEHNRHVNREGIGCTSCHDTAKLATSHFTGLATIAMSPASATLGNQIISYTNGSCSPRCHGRETW